MRKMLTIAALFVPSLAVAQPEQIDPNPWIPPRPPGAATDKAVQNWLHLTSPKLKHIKPILKMAPNRWHYTWNVRTANWAGLLLGPTNGSNDYDVANSSVYLQGVLPTTAPPSTGCNSNGCGVAFWSGFGGTNLGGGGTTNLAQAGFDVYFADANSPAQLVAWYEQAPQEPEIQLTNFTFSFGDQLEAYVAPGGWYLADFSNNTAMSGGWDYPVSGMNTAEVVAEPFVVGGQITLADFNDFPGTAYAHKGVSQQYFCTYVPLTGYYPTNYELRVTQGGQTVADASCSSLTNFDFFTEGAGY